MSEDNSGNRKRRDVLKALPVATVGVPMVSGVGAAMPDTSETSDERITREEKAREAGYDWDEDWIDQDMIGKSSVETTQTFSKTALSCVAASYSAGCSSRSRPSPNSGHAAASRSAFASLRTSIAPTSSVAAS